jgi:hypothetical protein
MSYWVKAVLGLALVAAGLGGFLYGLYELMNIGTCASGGPYVSARPCPEGTEAKALLLPGGLILGTVGIIVFALRGRRPGASEDAWRASAWLVGWAPLFIGTGVVALVAGLGSDRPDAGTAKFVGIFLAAMFIPMGLVPVLWTVTGGRSVRRRGGYAALTGDVLENVTQMAATAPQPVGPSRAAGPSQPVPPPSAVPDPGGDPAERLRKLAELRDRGVLSPAEFAAAKSKILAEL